MADIPRDLPDLLLDAIATALSAFSTSQSAPVQFHVSRDMTRLPRQNELPHVNVWLTDLNPEEQRSAKRTHAQERATINVDCIARGTEGAEPSDEAAATRLAYLRAQTRHALYMLANADFGFAAGTLAVKSWPRWQTFSPEDDKHEEQIVGGRWSLDIEYAWQPQDISHDPLTDASVADDTADMWAAQFTLPGGQT